MLYGYPVNMSNHSQNETVTSNIEIDGHTLVVHHPVDLAKPTGPVWVFIHGIAVTSAFWEPLMPAEFRDTVPWISVSLPVHAPSSGPADFSQNHVTPDLFNLLNGAVLDKLIPGRDVVIVGHSTGGFAGLCLALARPEQVRGVISVGGFADGKWVGLEGDMQLMARKEKLGAFGPTALRITAWLTTRWPWLHARTAAMFAYDKRAFLADKPSKTALRLMRRDARMQNQNQLIAFFAGIRAVDIWHKISRIKQPVLVLVGEFDPVIPADKTLRLARELPNGRLLLYPNTGHMVMNERREEFWRDIIAWQAKLLPKGKP